MFNHVAFKEFHDYSIAKLSQYYEVVYSQRVQYNVIFETYQSLEPPSSTPVRDRHVRPLNFCEKFNAQQLLFETFFNTFI